ncbi:MAG TPA: folate-binding protein [Rhizobacter sp.]|nr:folate-binding protein [Rhizobacter sp.]
MTSEHTLDGSVVLTHWGVIAARGADAASFLHSQLTSSFSPLGLSQARLAGYCSAKGRLLASFVGWKTSPEEILLACSADILAPTMKRLSMFVLRSKCKLSDVSAEIRLVGLAGPSATAWLGDVAPDATWLKAELNAASLIRLPDAAGAVRYLWAAPADTALPDLPALAPATWKAAEVASGVPTIEAATVDQFVPQMLNFELLGGVDFQKGCYPGQEIVARSQYRGTVKRRTFLFNAAAPAAAGQEIFHSADPGQPAGMVVNAAPALQPGAGSSLLVELKLAALDGGNLHLGSIEGAALTLAQLPYAVPRETA